MSSFAKKTRLVNEDGSDGSNMNRADGQGSTFDKKRAVMAFLYIPGPAALLSKSKNRLVLKTTETSSGDAKAVATSSERDCQRSRRWERTQDNRVLTGAKNGHRHAQTVCNTTPTNGTALSGTLVKKYNNTRDKITNGPDCSPRPSYNM